MLYGWIHCTLGDVLLTLWFFWIVSLLSRNRKWFLRMKGWNFFVFIGFGAAYTIYSEHVNVHVFQSWAYNEAMPIIPWIKVGLTPILQWMVIPFGAILLTRHHLMAEEAAGMGGLR